MEEVLSGFLAIIVSRLFSGAMFYHVIIKRKIERKLQFIGKIFVHSLDIAHRAVNIVCNGLAPLSH